MTYKELLRVQFPGMHEANLRALIRFGCPYLLIDCAFDRLSESCPEHENCERCWNEELEVN